jgi:inosose dehydratase
MIKVANAPCSWGVLEFGIEGEVSGYKQVLDEMREAGYAGTELGDWGFMPTDPELLALDLKKRGLDLLGAFVPVPFANESLHNEGVETALKTARLMADAGFNDAFLILADDNGTVPLRTENAGRITAEMALSDDQWHTFAAGVEATSKAIRTETGLRTAFHHHCGGYVETPEEVARLLALTDPDLVGLVYDTGHYRFGGGDPVQGLTDHFERICHVHFKDCSQRILSESSSRDWDYFESVSAGVFCELGEGCVDFMTVVEELRQRNYKGWIVVEQDVLPGMGTPLVCARRNREYLQTLSL